MENRMFAEISKWRKSLMGVAALWIWIFHCYSKLLIDTPLEFAESFFVQTGFCGVDIFLLLSGMGLVRSIKKGTLNFYLGRIKRVVVPFLLASLVLAVIMSWSVLDYVKCVSGYYFVTSTMYAYLWFVPVILIFYAFFPLYHYLFKRCDSKLVFTGCVLIIWLLLSFYGRGLLRSDLWGFTNRIPIFVIGIYLGDLSLEKDFEWKKSHYVFFVLMLITGAYASYICKNRDFFLLVPTSDCCIPNIFMSIALVFLLSRLFEALAHVREKRFSFSIVHAILGFYGMMSLEFYCLQERLRDYYLYRLNMSEPLAMLVIFVLTTVLAFLVYLVSKLRIPAALKKNKENTTE